MSNVPDILYHPLELYCTEIEKVTQTVKLRVMSNIDKEKDVDSIERFYSSSFLTLYHSSS